MFTYLVKLQKLLRAYLVQQLAQNVTDYTRIELLILHPQLKVKVNTHTFS